jgi:dipeptidyl aminopeptidase/acylaminoacyl peptidase
VLLYHLEDGRRETLLAAEYGAVPRESLARGRHIRYPSTGGAQVPAILYVPTGIAAGERRPALVHVHGGPTGQFTRGFEAFTQFLQGQGYVVIEPNVRGSTGYGTAWRDACIGDWGGKDLEDVEAAARYLRSLPEVDPGRVGILGTSYGGYLSYMAAAKLPDVFQVAIPMYGISDMPALEAETSPFLRHYLHPQRGHVREPGAGQDAHPSWPKRPALPAEPVPPLPPGPHRGGPARGAGRRLRVPRDRRGPRRGR